MMSTIAILAALASTGQYNVRVSTDVNGNYVDYVWTNESNTTCYYQRGGVNSWTMSWQGSSPDVSTNALGYRVFSYHVLNATQTASSVYLLAPAWSAPVLIFDGSTVGGNPMGPFNYNAHVNLTGEYFSVTWANGNTYTGSNTSGSFAGGTAYQVLAATYIYGGTPNVFQLTPTIPPYYSQPYYSLPDISADSSGNFVINYIALNTQLGASPGVMVARFGVNSSTPIYGPLAVYTNTTASLTYSQTAVSCWSDGSAVIAFDLPGGQPNYTSYSTISTVVVNPSGETVYYQPVMNPITTTLPSGGYGDAPNNLSIAAVPGSDYDYALTYQTNSYPNGVAGAPPDLFNIVYIVSNGEDVSSPIYITNAGHVGEDSSANTFPCVAMNNSGNFTIAFTYTPMSGSPSVLTWTLGSGVIND
jgi:hypothetical protein